MTDRAWKLMKEGLFPQATFLPFLLTFLNPGEVPLEAWGQLNHWSVRLIGSGKGEIFLVCVWPWTSASLSSCSIFQWGLGAEAACSHTEDDTYDRNDAHQTHGGLLQRVAYVLGRFILFWSP